MKNIVVTGHQFQNDDLHYCVELLRAGKVIAYPTETFYAFGIDPMNAHAVHKLYELKGRPAEKQFPLIASDTQMVRRACATEIPLFEQLASSFWPGPLTLVLPLRTSEASVAIRVSSHPVARMLSQAFGNPIVSTSANRSGEPPIEDPNVIASQFSEDLDALVNGGMAPGGLPSTIVALTDGSAIIIREGSIPSSQVLSLL